MRNRLLLLAAAVVLSACADDQNATAPGSPAARSRAAADLAPAGQAVVNPAAKPNQGGFTTVFTVVGSVVPIPVAQGRVTVTETCPAGSQAISGGYGVGNWLSSQFLTITAMGLNAANGWGVTGFVAYEPLATEVDLSAAVTCIK